ncbi:hypothetical protein BpHYR1_035314 [Brachionus plicatilis]|uniref:Uncharacterized protein n=1 Tax=Brachionus plicatilis TaxID=10195 RepID=A0A3M7RYJ6_BRAPC|nr:hypothetical protein BpHYR1_035314 [Brachionus plicatilis]
MIYAMMLIKALEELLKKSSLVWFKSTLIISLSVNVYFNDPDDWYFIFGSIKKIDFLAALT